MRAKGILDMEALHVIAFALQEQTWSVKESGGAFDMAAYVGRVQASVETFLGNRQLTRVGV